MKKHIIIWAITIGLIAGVTLALIATQTPVRRFPTGVRATGHDEAIILARFNDVAITRHFVTRVRSGEEAWTVETSPLQPAEGFDATAAELIDGRVVVVGTDGIGADWIIALAEEDGALLWRAQLPGTGGPEVGGRLGAELIVDAQRAYVVHDVFGATGLVTDRLDVVALDSGALVWSLPEDPARPNLEVRIKASDLFVAGAGLPAARFDAATGAHRATLGFEAIGCAADDGIVGFGADAIVWAPDGGAERRVELGPDVDLSWNTTCGFWGDNVVVDFTRNFMPRLASINRTSGVIEWEVALGLGTVMEGPVLLGNSLPFTLALPMCGQDGNDAPNWCVVVVVDMNGTIIARHRTDRAEAVRVITTGVSSWLWVRHAGMLVRVDDGGTLGTAWHLSGFVDLEPQRDDFHRSSMWFAPRFIAHPGELPWVVVGVDDMAPLSKHGDVEVRKASPRLGVPERTE